LRPMTTPQAVLAFTGAAALLTITPGLDTALVLRTAAVEGPRRAFLAGAGICLGCLTWGFAASAGLGALLVLSTVAFDGVRVLGAGYLFFLGLSLLRRRRRSPRADLPPAARTSPPGWFVRGLLTNLLNPKVGVFYLTFLPQFVPHGAAVTPFSMLLAGIHAAEGMLWFGLLIALTQPLSTWLARPGVTAILDKATGILLLGFGVRLVVNGDR
jgi:threonine/homoserine/homoserine lactone efflux protein